MLSRRGFFAGLAAAIAAPAVVKAASIMPVKVWKRETWVVYGDSPTMKSLADMMDLDGLARRYAETLAMPNDLLNVLEFDRAEDAFAFADTQNLSDMFNFGQAGRLVNPVTREIHVVNTVAGFNAASDRYAPDPLHLQRDFRIQTRFGDVYSGEPARFDARGKGRGRL